MGLIDGTDCVPSVPDLTPFVIKWLTSIDVGTYFSGGPRRQSPCSGLGVHGDVWAKAKDTSRGILKAGQIASETWILQMGKQAQRGQESKFTDHAVAEVQGESTFFLGSFLNPTGHSAHK